MESANAPVFQRLKTIALAVTDRGRAERFYGEILGLAPAFEAGQQMGFSMGDAILMLKDDWYGAPTALPNPRITFAVDDAVKIEAALKERGVTVADPVKVYDEGYGYNIGSFLDSEGNKLWFCSPIERKRA
jgi:catechol 2,3-dioxygenase-like lactoylglutathione lyase family enzyme